MKTTLVVKMKEVIKGKKDEADKVAIKEATVIIIGDAAVCQKIDSYLRDTFEVA